MQPAIAGSVDDQVMARLLHQRIQLLRVVAHDLGKPVELRLLLRRDLQLLFQIGDLAVDIAAVRLRRRGCRLAAPPA